MTPSFECPVCGHMGPFSSAVSAAIRREHAICPGCGAFERHRLLYLVLQQKIFPAWDPAEKKMLHFAPEPFLRTFFAERFAVYETADMRMDDVTYKVDLQRLPFADASYDFVLASHVLEHVRDDDRAIRELRRIIRPGGIAVLPVPLTGGERTIEFAAPDPAKWDHVRAPGLDYFQKYLSCFSRLEKHTSDDFPAKYQLHIYPESRTEPTSKGALEKEKADVIPVCFV